MPLKLGHLIGLLRTCSYSRNWKGAESINESPEHRWRLFPFSILATLVELVAARRGGLHLLLATSALSKALA